MFRLILLAGIVYLLFKWLRKSGPPEKREPPINRPGQTAEEMMQDPICGTYVPVSQAVTLKREKETLYFCSDECRDKFKEIPKAN